MKIAIGQIRTNFQNEAEISKYHLQITKDIFSGFADFMKADARNGFASVKDDKMWEEFNEATNEVVNAINGFVDWLSAQMINATEQFAMGKEKFEEMIKIIDGVYMPVADFKRIAEEDLQRNTLAFEKACQKYSPGKTTDECFKALLSQKKEYDPILIAQKQVPMLEKFLVEKNIVQIPDYANLLVIETPKFLRSYSAALFPPFPMKRSQLGCITLLVPIQIGQKQNA